MGEWEQFDGGLFDPALEGGRAAASIRFRSGCVEARIASGASFELPYAGLRIELGGHSGRVVFLRGAADGRVIFSEAKPVARWSMLSVRPFESVAAQPSRRRMRQCFPASTETAAVGAGFGLSRRWCWPASPG